MAVGQVPRLLSRQPAPVGATGALLANLRVLDTGPVLAIDPRQDEDPEGVERLQLSQEKGIHPVFGRRAILHVERKTGKVLQSQVSYRAGRDVGDPTYFDDYRQIGPLRLSLKREGASNQMADVSIHVKAPTKIFERKRALLGDLAKKAVHKPDRRKQEQKKDRDKQNENTRRADAPTRSVRAPGGDPRKVHFVRPFKKAVERATRERRLFFVKPV